MKKNIKISFFVIILIFLLAIFFIIRKSFDFPEAEQKTVEIKLGQEFFTAEVANSQKDKEKGLAGKKSLCEKCAMLFLFDDSTKRVFWMKGMQFDIDIIWINENKIVGISRNISHKKGEKELINSVENVNKAIEINFGMSEKIGLKVGDEIK